MARGRSPLVGKLVIFGVGLIGGSLALALKKRKSVARVVGVGRSRANLLAARRLGIIDEIATDPALAVQDADLVLLAVPLGQTAAVLAQIAPHLAAKTVVTDAGSTKRDVIAHARKYLGAAFARFVPAHPIAGTEKSGARAAFAGLFDGHRLIVTPEPETGTHAVTTVSAMWKLAGMRVTTMRAADHDRIYALVSHLPHVLAFALVDQPQAIFGVVRAYRRRLRFDPHRRQFARDVARRLSRQPQALLAAPDDYLDELELLRGMIEASDGQGLEARFAAARATRAKWLVRK